MATAPQTEDYDDNPYWWTPEGRREAALLAEHNRGVHTRDHPDCRACFDRDRCHWCLEKITGGQETVTYGPPEDPEGPYHRGTCSTAHGRALADA